MLAAPLLGTPTAVEIVLLSDSKGLQEQVRLLHAELVNEDPARAARWGAALLWIYQHTLHRTGAKRTKRDRAAKLQRGKGRGSRRGSFADP